MFDVIYADPPWRYSNSTPNRRIENHYPTMTDGEICALRVQSNRDSVLYLWATASRLESALNVIKAWGFKYKTSAVWDKQILGMGYWFRGQHELLLVATKGIISPPRPEFRISSVIRCDRGQHSSKPDYIRTMIEKWFPNSSRIEMFSRLQRPSWTSFGNQVEHDLFSNADNQLPGHRSKPKIVAAFKEQKQRAIVRSGQ